MFTQNIKDKAVSEVKAGATQKSVAKKYKTTTTSLHHWIKKAKKEAKAKTKEKVMNFTHTDGQWDHAKDSLQYSVSVVDHNLKNIEIAKLKKENEKLTGLVTKLVMKLIDNNGI